MTLAPRQAAAGQFCSVTDPTCDPGNAEVQKLGVICLPLTVHLQGQRFRDWTELDPDALYEQMRGGHPATTSPPSTEAFVRVYGDLLRAGKQLLSLHLSGHISQTAEHARQAVKQLDAEDRGLDSGLGSAGLCGLVVPDLEYLRRGGRRLGNLTRMHPVLGFGGGRTVPRSRVRMPQGEHDLIKRQEERAQSQPVTVTVYHAGRDQARLQEVQSAVRQSKLEVARGQTQLIGCVVGAHVARGTYGFVSVPAHMA